MQIMKVAVVLHRSGKYFKPVGFLKSNKLKFLKNIIILLTDVTRPNLLQF
jgi:hypothetical protein